MQSDNIQIAQRSVTSIVPHDTREIQLRVIDWRRIYRKIKSIKASLANRELFSGVAWGITGSALLSLIPLYQSAQAVDSWVKPTFWIVAVGSLVVGIVIWRSLKDSAADVAEAQKEVLNDMEELDCLYFPDEKLKEQ
jgi:hypothetical protein